MNYDKYILHYYSLLILNSLSLFLLTGQEMIYMYINVQMYYRLVSWCLMPLSNNISVILVEKITDLSQVNDKFYHIMLFRVYLAWAGFELTTSVVIASAIGNDCICSCKSNYHKITTTTAPVLCTLYMYILEQASKWLPFNAKRVFFQPDYDENKLHSDEMSLSWIFIVLAHSNNSQLVAPLQNQYLLLLLNVAYLQEKQ